MSAGAATSILLFLILITPSIAAAATPMETNAVTLPFPIFEDDENAATSSPAVYPYSSSDMFKPSTGVLVGVLTATFSLTFLFLLYIKHCAATANVNTNSQVSSHVRKNSGIDRDILESLPVFRFESLKGQKNGHDCAVCLAKFEDTEVLRLLPKCKHAFHVECVDAWLDEHSTCPLCRYKVEPDNVVLSSEGEVDIERGRNDDASPEENQTAGTTSVRRSFDSAELRLLERCIFISPFGSLRGGVRQRWSDFQPRDVLYLTAEISTWKAGAEGRSDGNNNNLGGSMENGGPMANLRSVSEVTGMRSIVYLSRS